MTDRYAVIGHPIAHSRSPFIHQRFAEQTGQDLSYERLLAPLDGFESVLRRFADEGGRGVNVTVPFKEQAFALATRRSPRVVAAGAANTLSLDGAAIEADNTDGIGLVRDLVGRHGQELDAARVILLGAGGAASGVVLPLMAAGVAEVLIVNRTAERARMLAERLSGLAEGSGRVLGGGFELLEACRVDDVLLVNATSAGLSDAGLPIPGRVFAAARLAYDMVYAARPTHFLRQAGDLGCPRCVDGLGMLVEQAAESFRIWRGVMPQTDPVHRALREVIGQT